MTLALFEITNQFKDLERLAEEEDLPSEMIADTLEGLAGQFEDKAVAVAKFVLSLQANAHAIDNAAEAMQKRAKRLMNRADSVRAYLLFQLQLLDKRKIETDEIRISRRANPEAVQVSDEHGIPDRFWVQPDPPPKRIDKKALKTALQAGEKVDGAFLESGERVEIKI